MLLCAYKLFNLPTQDVINDKLNMNIFRQRIMNLCCRIKWICFSGKYRKVSKDPRLDKMRETERKEFSKELGRKLTKAEDENMSAHKKESLRKKIARNRDGTKKKRRPRKR